MLGRATWVKVAAFLAIAVAVLAYIGVRYAEVGHYFGLRSYYVVKVELADSGGIFPNAEVTYRGVPVGTVGSLHLTDSGLIAKLHVNESAPPVPADVEAVVRHRSAVGEPYVDLRPQSAGGPYLAHGSVIQNRATGTPLPITDVVRSFDTLADSVPKESLRTVVDELDKAFSGQGQNLRVLLERSHDFTQAAEAHLPASIRLIHDSQTVLETQSELSDELSSFSGDFALLAGQFKESDPDLEELIGAAPGAAEQASGLLRETDPELSVMLANLLTVSHLTVTRQAGLEQLLVTYPQAIAAGRTVVDSGAINVGMAVTFFNPLPCVYEDTNYRNGLDIAAGPPLNADAGCDLPPGSPTSVRGSAHAPNSGVPPAAEPGSLDLFDADGSGLPGVLGGTGLAGSPASMGELMGLRE